LAVSQDELGARKTPRRVRAPHCTHAAQAHQGERRPLRTSSSALSCNTLNADAGSCGSHRGVTGRRDSAFPSPPSYSESHTRESCVAKGAPGEVAHDAVILVAIVTFVRKDQSGVQPFHDSTMSLACAQCAGSSHPRDSMRSSTLRGAQEVERRLPLSLGAPRGRTQYYPSDVDTAFAG